MNTNRVDSFESAKPIGEKMADEEKLRSELRHHIENEMKKANSEDDLTQDEIVKSSLFENELRTFLKSPYSVTDESVDVRNTNELNDEVTLNVWQGIVAQEDMSEDKTDSFNQTK